MMRLFAAESKRPCRYKPRLFAQAGCYRKVTAMHDFGCLDLVSSFTCLVATLFFAALVFGRYDLPFGWLQCALIDSSTDRNLRNLMLGARRGRHGSATAVTRQVGRSPARVPNFRVRKVNRPIVTYPKLFAKRLKRQVDWPVNLAFTGPISARVLTC